MTKVKKAGLFDFLNAIYQNQTMNYYDSLSDGDKREYKNSRWMIHRFISMNPHYLPVANAIQPYTKVPDRVHYMFLTQLLPKGKQFNKYIKGKKDVKYESWLVDLVSNHYKVSTKEAKAYLEIFYSQDKESLRKLCEKYAVEKKQLKKAKL